jgi:6-phosphofructokinase 1
MKRIGVMTSGGDSPGMNAAIRAVVRTAIYHGLDVFGVQHGYQGMIDGQIEPMTARTVSGIIHRGGTILHTARCAAFMEAEGRAKAAAQLQHHGIEGMVLIGGDGTYRGAEALHAEYGVCCIGMPGTIDNDIGGTEFTIGFDTAMNTAMEAIDRLRDTAASHDRIFFVEVMGRHNGYIAMMSGLAGGAEEILVPESTTTLEQLVESMRTGRARGKDSMIVVVAEGDELGSAFEVAQKVAEISEFKDTRVAVIGHLQRGGSPTAFDRVLASRMGVCAVEALIAGETGKMVGISNQEMVLRPFSDSRTVSNRPDLRLLETARILSV